MEACSGYSDASTDSESRNKGIKMNKGNIVGNHQRKATKIAFPSSVCPAALLPQIV